MDKIFPVTTVTAVLLLCLGIIYSPCQLLAVLLLCLDILYSPCQVHHEVFSNLINSIGIIAPFVFISSGIFFLQVHQMHSWHFWGGLVALDLLKGEETGSSWFWNIIGHLSPWAPEQLYGIFLLCFSGSP